MTGGRAAGLGYDVIVAGGGPIGLAAAIEARLCGMTVAVCEPRPSPIDKACGEGLMPGAVTALRRLGVYPEGRPFHGIRYVGGDTVADHDFRAGPGLGVRRTVLHAALERRAREVGAVIVPRRVSDVVQDATGVYVAGEPALRARWLLGCDGLHSRLRSLVGADAPARGPARFGIRRHVRISPWSRYVEVHWTPRAEVYVTPVADDLVGIAVLGPRGMDFATTLADAGLWARLADAEPGSSLRGAGPLRQRTVRRVAGRALLVGDSAGYVDALTGEGIRIGLEQVRAAIAAVAEDDPASYEREWRRLTRDYRLLTSGLLAAGRWPWLRSRLVPAAQRLPRVYGAIVDRLAGAC